MTISYNAEVATTRVGTFARLLFRWKGSVYKLLWKELLVFAFFFALVKIIYEYALNCTQQRDFELWAVYCKQHLRTVPLTFIMSIYVRTIINRWWKVFQSIGWTDRPAYYVSMCVTSNQKADELSKQYRLAIVRYLNLAQLLVLRKVSTAVKARYPTDESVIEGGLMTREEYKVYDLAKDENGVEQYHKYWIVIQWAIDVLNRAASHGLVRDRVALTSTISEILKYRSQLGSLMGHDWVTIPLAYTQLVTMVVYFYFMTVVFGQQHLHQPSCHTAYNGTYTDKEVQEADASQGTVVSDSQQPGFYVPIFPILEFVYVVGLLKTAQSIMNPLGEDDDDFEINYFLSQNVAVSYAIVDSYRNSCPPVEGETEPTLAETEVKSKPFSGSATKYKDGDTDAPNKPPSDETDTAGSKDGKGATTIIEV